MGSSLTPRGLEVLHEIVEAYIATGEPVASRTIARGRRDHLSPASIRNVMADLEDMGFITSPHTSAGRVPTPAGYRFFVDTLLTIKPLDRVEINQLQDNLAPEHPQKLMTAAGYTVQLLEFIDMEHTPKNVLLRCVRRMSADTSSSRAAALQKARALRQTLNLPPLRLERLLFPDSPATPAAEVCP